MKRNLDLSAVSRYSVKRKYQPPSKLRTSTSSGKILLVFPHQRSKLLLRQNRHPQGASLVQLGARVSSHHNIGRFFTHARGYTRSCRFHRLLGAVSREVIQPAGKHKRLSCERGASPVPCCHARCNLYAGFPELCDDLPVVRLRPIDRQAFGNLRTNFTNLLKPFSIRRHDVIERPKLTSQDFGDMLADLPNPESHEKAIQRDGLTTGNRLQEERGGPIGKPFKPNEVGLGYVIEVGE